MSIVIIIAIIIIVYMKANTNAQKRANQERKRYDNRMQTTAPVRRGVSGTQGRPAGTSGPYTGNNAAGSTMQKAPGSGLPVKKTERQAESDASTTDYLERKAKQEQMEHVKEKLEEQRRINAKYGNRSVAGRYLLGDAVPAGFQIVCCDYCGAENIVKIGYKSGLSCYFCRSHLEN